MTDPRSAAAGLGVAGPSEGAAARTRFNTITARTVQALFRGRAGGPQPDHREIGMPRATESSERKFFHDCPVCSVTSETSNHCVVVGA